MMSILGWNITKTFLIQSLLSGGSEFPSQHEIVSETFHLRTVTSVRSSVDVEL